MNASLLFRPVIKQIAKITHMPIQFMKPKKPKEIMTCLCKKCLGYDIQQKPTKKLESFCKI